MTVKALFLPKSCDAINPEGVDSGLIRAAIRHWWRFQGRSRLDFAID
ncbi:hypothetical protein MYAER_0703 [Microcystis aeruginosa NIES-2549]|uniref:Uncharacterized protein n=1 Tax=Microcystis aeruginosa NIES-2549 TaxID=1641812 RepID=A0A0F6RJZ9_MICAE|nr:hypothetical protein MYAER_0703 [Microcystis aeruginosa NIES-2549]